MYDQCKLSNGLTLIGERLDTHGRTELAERAQSELGATLLKGFVFAVSQLPELPKTVLLYNGGVTLAVPGSDSLQDLQELERQGVPWGGHRSRQVTMDDYRHFDRIYYMDRSNARYLERLLPHDPEKIRPLLSRDVADPWYTGDFETTYRDLVEGCKKILEEFP